MTDKEVRAALESAQVMKFQDSRMGSRVRFVHLTEQLAEELLRARAQLTGILEVVNTPQTEEFFTAVKNEAAHQRARWGKEHDERKDPEHWFWTLGFLSGKALRFAIAQAKALAQGEQYTADAAQQDALHHVVSSAALLLLWHAHVKDGGR